MNLTPEYLSEIFREITDRDFFFNEALSIVRQNCQGKIWLIGGFLYKNLASIIYQNKIAKLKDIDFLVEHKEMNDCFAFPRGWSFDTSKFGGVKLRNKKFQIDIIDIEEFFPMSSYGSEPTIDNFLIYNPLNVQSIAYDVFEKKVLGEAGIRALERKIVRINNEDSAYFCSRIMRKTVIEMVLEKAKDLGFEAEFI